MLQLSMVLLPSPSMITMLATISTDSQYSISVHKTLTTPITDHHVTDWEVFKLLDKLRPTATGLDLIPAWFLRLAAPVLCKPLSRLFNLSVSTGIVPLQWKQAYFDLFQKYPLQQHKLTLDQFPSPQFLLGYSRRLMYIDTYIHLFSLPHPHLTPTLTFRDQFAFRPTGSLFPSFMQSPLSLLPTPMLLSLPWISARLLIQSVTRLSF